MKLENEPSLEDVFKAVGAPEAYKEVVFCGYGEPTVRFELMKQIAKGLKEKGAKKIRLNTDGLASLAEGRDVTEELKGLIDSVSISLNAHNAEVYKDVCPSKYGENAHQAILDFIKSAVKNIKDVTVTAVTIPEVDIKACEKLALSLGAKFKAREYQKVG